MTTQSRQISFVAGADALALIENLKSDLRAPSTADVLRKALALAKLAVDQAGSSEGIVRLRGLSQPQNAAVEISLRA